MEHIPLERVVAVAVVAAAPVASMAEVEQAAAKMPPVPATAVTASVTA